MLTTILPFVFRKSTFRKKFIPKPNINKNFSNVFVIIIITLISNINCKAQTDADGIMMQKKLFCIGSTYQYSIWKNYWEGTFKRENLNLGNVSNSAISIMGNYGISDRFNIIFGLPYITTKASSGQLTGQNGIQDCSIYAKMASKIKSVGKGEIKGVIIAGFSAPLTNYSPDIMPLSIGLHSATASIKTMADYDYHNFSASISSAFIYRGNVTLDRNTYYTTELHYSNKVYMPNVSNFQIRAGFRGVNLIAEGVIDQTNTLGGFDISKNNMPFVSNRMIGTKAGLHIKYEVPKIDGLSVIADAMFTLAGRNIGQINMYGTGLFYVINTKKKNAK